MFDWFVLNTEVTLHQLIAIVAYLPKQTNNTGNVLKLLKCLITQSLGPWQLI